MSLTQDGVLSYLLERGGKVKNTELLSAFTAHVHCSEPEERTRNRDMFKGFINNVAVVQRVDGVKYVVVKKKYQKLINEGKSSIVSSSSPSSSSSSSSSSSFTTRQSCFSTCESHTRTRADVLNNNSWFCTSPPGCSVHNPKDLVTKHPFQLKSTGCDAEITPVTTSEQDRSLTARVRNVTDNTIHGKTEAVFAVVPRKSPPLSQPQKVKVNHRKGACHQSFKIPPQEESVTGEPEKSSPYPSQNKSPRIKRRQTAGPCSPAPKRGNKAVKPGSDVKAKDSSAVRLEPQEHEWFVKSATGCWSQLYRLLLQDVHLAQKRNFLSGFTALHWAAKHGNSQMLCRVLDSSQKVDVNIKSHDGYTPLHVAAIHGHESVLNVLVRDYGANCNIRDNSGKKAYQYLRKDLSAEVRELLGDPAVSCQATEHARSDDQHFSDLSKNLSAFSKLFQASVGHRKKPRRRSSFCLFSHEQEENRKECTFDALE